jgi:transcriptional repressor NF-X1
VKKEVIDGQQKTNRDASEKFVSDGSHSNAPARQRGGPKSTRNRARDMDRNWRERSEDDDGAKNEATGSTLPVKKHEAIQPVTEGLQKLTREERGRETEKKKSKKSGRSAPKKTSHPEDKQVVPTLQSSELTQQLSAGSYSCMVCCDRVRGRDAVWSCRGCYHVFHLECIRKWATSPASLLNDKDPSEGWRCPACQRASQTVPTLYQCYCRKITNPRPRSKGDLMAPHSCGELCGQNLARTPQSLCQHKCQLLCHPGPCPPCPVMVTRSCPCGRHDYQVRCSKTGDLPSCGSVCGRKLSCGRHHCDLACHAGSCPACEAVLTQRCHCGRNQRDVVCGKGEGERYGCGRTCGKELDCGNHLCELACHPLPCPSCTLLPSRVTSCPCGATPLSLLLSADHSRMSCLDPVPTCGATCGKLLPCSTRGNLIVVTICVSLRVTRCRAPPVHCSPPE